MSRGELMRGSVRPAKGDRNIELTARHHEHVRRVVHDLIERDERKTPGHELNDRPQTGHGRADAQTGESVFANRRVDDSFRSEAFKQSLADFVSTVIL